ncbi:MAG: cation:proton antiporter [Acidimicrobiales bacterium]|nr:cation:proton antiporter [Acidimicrobiales bacterium]
MIALVVGAAGGDVALAFIEIGAVVLALAGLSRVAERLGITAIPLYLLAGLAIGEGGVATLVVSEDFISLAAQIGVLLLLFTLGLEYTGDELRTGLRTGVIPGLVDALANFLPGLGLGLLLGWEPTAAILLGGVTWISSSGVISKVLGDLRRLGNRETPSVLNVLVFEDLAMAVYLPIVAALIADQTASATVITVAIALVAVSFILVAAIRWGEQLSALLAPGSDESLLLTVFGLTLLVGGLAEQVQVSSAIGAFLVGIALSGRVRDRAEELIGPLRDLFAATFFLFFSFQIEPSTVFGALVPAVGLGIVTAATKLVSGHVSAAKMGVGPAGRMRAGTALIARGEFSIVIASLGVGLADGEDLGALAAAYVLLTAVVGPLLAKYSDSLPQLSRRRARPRSPA